MQTHTHKHTLAHSLEHGPKENYMRQSFLHIWHARKTKLKT